MHRIFLDYKAYEKHFNTPDGPNELAHFFEIFVEDWDWQGLFNNHLGTMSYVLFIRNEQLFI